jgi:ribonuclease HI
VSNLEEFHKRRNIGNELISKENNINFNRFFNLDTNAYIAGEISAKHKELMGLACSMVLRCNDCITYHIDQCHKLCCTKNEIIEALNIALVIGGSIVIPHLRYALEIVNELSD